MSRLKFGDINEWTPSSISIVDEPAHPLCKFEVYEDDEEYVKKSIEIQEGEMMVEENPQSHEEPMVQAPVSFFERLLGRTVGKAIDEIPEKPPEKEEKVDSALEERIAKLESRVAELEKDKKKPDDEEDDPAPGAVTKSEGEAGEGEEATPEDKVIDEEEVVAKSKSLDPDTITIDSTDKSLMERTGRKSNGMTW